MTGDNAIQARMSELSNLDRSDLRVAWVKAFGMAPPHHISMMFMRKALIWDAQCHRFGGLPSTMKRALKVTADGKLASMPAAAAAKPGTQLIREWNGRRYSVEVKEGGYMLGEERFKSLSAIALHITGTNWSGPRFFGLTGGTRAASQ